MLDDDVIVEPAPAKLNLALHVRRRQADGYHAIETIFAFARDGDVLTVAPAATDSLAITGPFAAALTGAHASGAGERMGEGLPNNLVLKAARGFRLLFAEGARHAFTLEKNLPVASGIGGGSADAAAALRALARLHGVAADEPRLIEIARALGADVPACLLGRTALGSGRGDDLTPLAPLGDLPTLLVNPGVPVSTAQVFAGWDGVDRGPIDAGAPLAAARAGGNDLTAPALALAPAIAAVLTRLARAPGAHFVRMSGSGATCFALFADVAERAAAAAALRAEQPGWWVFETSLA